VPSPGPPNASNTRPVHSVSHAHAEPDARRLLPLQLAIGAVVVALDQLVKWWAVERLGDGEVIELFWTAQFRLVRNDGAAFGLGTSITPVITIAATTISIAVILYGRSVRRLPVAVALGAVLGGAVGNVIDRFLRPGDGFLRGAVIDYIDFQWWPVFNIADIAIVCGGFALVFLLRDEDLTRKAPAHAAAGDSVEAADDAGPDDAAEMPPS
jgi:signal peptidase II